MLSTKDRETLSTLLPSKADTTKLISATHFNRLAGEYIYQVRDKLNMLPQQVVGLNPDLLSAIEYGEVNLTLRNLTFMSKAYNIPLGEFAKDIVEYVHKNA